MYGLRQRGAFLCKEMEDPPKDSKNVQTWRHIITTVLIKKESPNEGTETSDGDHSVRAPLDIE